MIPGLTERLVEGSNEDVVYIGELVRYISIVNLAGPDLETDTKRFCQCEGR